MDSAIRISLEELPSADSIEKAREEAQAELSQTGSRLARLKWPLLRDAAANSMKTGLSQVDAFDVLCRAWCTAIELKELAAKTKAEPGKTEPYSVGEHDLSATVHPVVTLRCGPLKFPALKFTVTVAATVKTAILMIADGRLKSVEALSLTPSAALKYGSDELYRIDRDPIAFADPIEFPHGGFEIPCD